jgi:hypothetical protein
MSLTPCNTGDNTNATSLCRVKTRLCADSVEWCPILDDTQLMVCGNYQLNESTREKNGCIIMFDVHPTTGDMEQIQAIDTDAVLDLKWYPLLSSFVSVSSSSRLN